MKHILNLDPSWKVPENWYYNSGYYQLEVESFNFVGGEPHIKITTPPAFKSYGDKILILQRFNSSEDIVKVLLANDALKRLGFKDIELFIPYFPAGRQDRPCVEGEPLSLKVFASMINSCGFSKVITFSPHSDVTGALLDNCEFLDYNEVASEAFFAFKLKSKTNKIAVVSPDAGAAKKVYSLFEKVKNEDVIFVQAGKIRNPNNGELSGTRVEIDSLEGYDCMVFDDVVCKGGTFTYLSKELVKKGCERLGIFVGHADCEEGVRNLIGHYDFVSFTNSRDHSWSSTISKNNPNLIMLDLLRFF